MNTHPVIFQHYGYSPYLRYTLSCAVRTNPNKQIILLGDDKNKFLEKYGVKHFFLQDFVNDDLLKGFNRNYSFIAGENFEKVTYGRQWVNFNFKKWFILNNFVRENSITNFWVFDSDNLILKDLSKFEKELSALDCTTYNNENAIQGVVNNIEVLDSFCRTILTLFSDKAFLKSQEKEFLIQGTFGFTMMRAFKYFFNNNDGIKRKSLDNSIQYFVFDECLFFQQNADMIEIPRFNKEIKRLYFDQDGELFLRQKSDNQFIKLAVLNLSWVPLDVFLRTCNIKFKKKKPFQGVREFDYNNSLFTKCNTVIDKGLSKLHKIKIF